MENINNDIIKLTTLLESTQDDNDSNESSSCDEESQETFELQPVSKNEDSFLPESITNDEDTIFIIETCSDPLIKNALICNIKKRNILNELIKNLEENLTKIKNIQRENFIRTLNGNKLNKKLIIKKRLGIPYFKDSNFFPSPPNADTVLMQKNKHYCVLDCVKKENWSTFHKCQLIEAVYKLICSNKLAEIQLEMHNLETEIYDTDVFAKKVDLKGKQVILNNTELIESLAKQWQYIKICDGECIFIKNKLIDKTDNTNYIVTLINNSELTSSDWQIISDETFEGKFTPMECKSMWECYLHPKYSKEPWKDCENVKLQEIAEKWNLENWDAIANDLNTQKSAYQCCIHFYSKLFDKFLRTKWTVEEEKLLKELVNASRIGDHINWTKIAHYFKGRTKAQIYAHYYQAMLPSLTKGTFTIEEDVLLLTLLKLHNNDMKIVKLYFPARSLTQLRDRFKTMSRDDSQDWTIKDDCRIVEHVEQHGARKWYLLDDMNRSNACIRHRYYTLKKWFEQNPNDDLHDVQRRFKTAYRRKIKTRFNLLNTAVQKLLNVAKNNSSDDMEIFNLDYIHKNILSTIPFYKTLKKNKNNTSMYKNKSKVRRQKSVDTEGTLHHYCVNFFQPAFKKISRGKMYLTDEDFNAKAKRVMNILELLGAKLILPTNDDEIEENIILTSADKNVVREMIKLRSAFHTEKVYNTQLQYLIPPTPETLIGLRGLMLHAATLRSHSRGNYVSYSYYVHLEQRFEKKGINYIKRRNDIHLAGLKNDDKQIVIQERVLFWKRLKILFSWPCIMQDAKIEPNIEDAPPEEPAESLPVVAKKRGRPMKNNKIWKINLMNKARLEKKTQVSNETSLNLPSTSKTGLSVSNTENKYKLTKHDCNSFSVEFKSIPEPVRSSGSISLSENKQILNTKNNQESDSDDDELDEDVQKILMESKNIGTREKPNNVIINQMSKAIEDVLKKNHDTIDSDNDDDDDDELDEDVQKLLVESKNIGAVKKPDNVVIGQMSKAIKDILVKKHVDTINGEETEKTNETSNTLNIESNKRKAKIIMIPSKKVKITN